MKASSRRIFADNYQFRIYKDNRYCKNDVFLNNSHWEFDTDLKTENEVRKLIDCAFRKSREMFHFGRIIMPTDKESGFIELINHYDIIELDEHNGILVDKEEYLIP